MTPQSKGIPPLRIQSLDRERVWGGTRLGDGQLTIGESWGAYACNQITGGPLDGMTLAEACRRYSEALLGKRVVERTGSEFPILTKVLDTSDWLSVQLHPNDVQACKLEGPGQSGKTEAWHLLETAPDAEIILGLQPGVGKAEFAEAVRSGSTLEVIARQPAIAGDTWFIPAGTVHALGPGILLYEVQQASDVTYRVYDWDRPASAGRALHLDQAIECVDPDHGECRSTSQHKPGTPVRLVSCPYFTLDSLVLDSGAEALLDTERETFHALTAVAGAGCIETGSGAAEIERFDTLLVPASAGQYEIASATGVTLMIAASIVT